MTSVQHIAMSCRDRKASEDFYTGYFGFKRARVFNRGASNEFVLLRLGSVCIELFPASESARGEMGGEQPVGFRHLAFEVDDLEKTVEKLRADGIETKDIADCSHIIEGFRVCFFKDPDGNVLELMAGYRDE